MFCKLTNRSRVERAEYASDYLVQVDRLTGNFQLNDLVPKLSFAFSPQPLDAVVPRLIRRVENCHQICLSTVCLDHLAVVDSTVVHENSNVRSVLVLQFLKEFHRVGA